MDIGHIREQLNEVTFENGQRQTHIGYVSELFGDMAPDEIPAALEQLAQQLRRHDLALVRSTEDPDELLVVQKLKYAEVNLAWMAQAIQWVSKITTVALEMVVPAVAGTWLDRHFGTQFLGLLGLILGVSLGLWHLLRLTQH